MQNVAKVVPIQTIVLLDLIHDSNDPNVTLKVSFLAAPREDFLKTEIERVKVQPQDVLILSIRNKSGFDDNFFNSVHAFVCRQKHPVCLFAYGGNKFDFPVLKMKLENATVSFSDDLMCAVSLFAFYDVEELKPEKYGNAVRAEFYEGNPRPETSYKLWDIYGRYHNRYRNIVEKINVELDNDNKAGFFIAMYLGPRIIKWVDAKQRSFGEVRPTDLFQ